MGRLVRPDEVLRQIQFIEKLFDLATWDRRTSIFFVPFLSALQSCNTSG